MDMRTILAAQGYAAMQPAGAIPAPGAGGSAEGGPGAALARVAADFAQTMQGADTTAAAAMTGRSDAHALVQALARSELAIETAAAVRNKIVEAYQEILRMPV